MLGFMGLGLVVGVAALGVISARSVVERRQQIGVLRSIGFRAAWSRLSFLLESSFIALTAIGVGTPSASSIAYNVDPGLRRPADLAGRPARSSCPGLHLAIVFLAVYAAALLTTSRRRRAPSRVQPGGGAALRVRVARRPAVGCRRGPRDRRGSWMRCDSTSPSDVNSQRAR